MYLCQITIYMRKFRHNLNIKNIKCSPQSFFTNPNPQFRILTNMSTNKALACLNLLSFLIFIKTI